MPWACSTGPSPPTPRSSLPAAAGLHAHQRPVRAARPPQGDRGALRGLRPQVPPARAGAAGRLHGRPGALGAEDYPAAQDHAEAFLAAVPPARAGAPRSCSSAARPTWGRHAGLRRGPRRSIRRLLAEYPGHKHAAHGPRAGRAVPVPGEEIPRGGDVPHRGRQGAARPGPGGRGPPADRPQPPRRRPGRPGGRRLPEGPRGQARLGARRRGAAGAGPGPARPEEAGRGGRPARSASRPPIPKAPCGPTPSISSGRSPTSRRSTTRRWPCTSRRWPSPPAASRPRWPSTRIGMVWFAKQGLRPGGPGLQQAARRLPRRPADARASATSGRWPTSSRGSSSRRRRT